MYFLNNFVTMEQLCLMLNVEIGNTVHVNYVNSQIQMLLYYYVNLTLKKKQFYTYN